MSKEEKIMRFNKALALVKEQAKNEDLWFMPKYVTESYLQNALRKLAKVIEEG